MWLGGYFMSIMEILPVKFQNSGGETELAKI